MLAVQYVSCAIKKKFKISKKVQRFSGIKK